MKQQTEKEKNEQDAQLKFKEMEQKDQHKTWELKKQKTIERMKLEAKQRRWRGQDRGAAAEGGRAIARSTRPTCSASKRISASNASLAPEDGGDARRWRKPSRPTWPTAPNERQMAQQQKMDQGALGGKV